MGYNLIITEKADLLLDNLINYLLTEIKSKQAARHLLDAVDTVLDRITINPYQFPECKDVYLSQEGFREARLSDMRYIVIYYIENIDIYISGFYHELELYRNKIEIK